MRFAEHGLNVMLLDFTTIPARRRPNACLACPPSWNRSDADIHTALFSVPVSRLREAVVAIASREPRTHLLSLDREASQAEFEQRSRILGFVDTITVAFEAASNDTSTIAIYSHSRTGYYDLGVNRRRVRRWLAALANELAANGDNKAAS